MELKVCPTTASGFHEYDWDNISMEKMERLYVEIGNLVEQFLKQEGGGMSEWISVEDRLPEHTGAVLVANRGNYGGIIKTIVEIGYFNIEKRWVNWHDCYFTDVTHWMPLPEPPAEQEEK